jgi:LAO/AO transport system kinase
MKLKLNSEVKVLLPKLSQMVTEGETTPYLAASQLINILFKPEV